MNVRKNESKLAPLSTVQNALPHFRSVPPFKSARPSAFTLVELLVAIAVMILILGIMVQVSSGTLLATKGISQKMEAGEGARAVLGSLGADLASLAKAQGLTVFVSSSPGVSSSTPNSVLAFITQSRGPNTSTRFVSVTYQLSTTGQLTRYSQPIVWTDQNLVSDAVSATSPAAPTFSVLAQGILRFEAVAVLDDGTLQITAASSQSSISNSAWNNTTIYGQAIPNMMINGQSTSCFGLNLTDRGVSSISNQTTGNNYFTYSRRRVQALIVGVVVLDSKNYTLLTNSGKLTSTEGLFTSPAIIASPPPATQTTQTPMDAWEPILWNGSLNVNGLPKPVIPAIQVFQSTYPLN